MSAQDEGIWGQRYKDVCQSVFYRIAQNRTGRIGIFPKSRKEVFVQNTARRNWQDKCFSRGHHNSLMEITATASSRTKGNS